MSASTSERGNRDKKGKGTMGWAAFDLKQRQKQGNLESDNDSEDYPLLSAAPNPPESFFTRNGGLLEKPFSSVVVASMNFPSLVDTQNIETAVPIEAYQKLKYSHPWADESLIQDVLAGVNNNVDEALSLLEAMLVSDNKDANSKEVESDGNDIATFDIQDDSSGENTDLRETKDEAPSMQCLGASNSLPIETEPEWEEDDLYLIHRKDAIRMVRSAARHSKAANDAYIRGDHTSALHFSLKAQEEWVAAEKFNAKAAKEILNLRNSENDPWALDLHGLHATEAVVALRERLQSIESLVSPNSVVTPNGVYKESGMFLDAAVPTTIDVKFGRQHPPSRLRPKLLQVITGKGNHSRGAAALPSAIRNFLNENRYHFDETRPGVIMIQPKFRQL